jgi:hypothetical protein
MRTTLDGYAYCKDHPDKTVRQRAEGFKKRLKIMRYFLTASTIFVQNRQSEILLREIKKSFRSELGRTKTLGLALSMLVVCYSVKEYLRCRLVGDARMPKTSYRPVNRERMKGVKPARFPERAKVSSKAAYGWSQQSEH